MGDINQQQQNDPLKPVEVIFFLRQIVYGS